MSCAVQGVTSCTTNVQCLEGGIYLQIAWAVCQRVIFAGYTPLGSGLEARCIIPFVITPARNNFLKKPVLVGPRIITCLDPELSRQWENHSAAAVTRSVMPLDLLHSSLLLILLLSCWMDCIHQGCCPEDCMDCLCRHLFLEFKPQVATGHRSLNFADHLHHWWRTHRPWRAVWYHQECHCARQGLSQHPSIWRRVCSLHVRTGQNFTVEWSLLNLGIGLPTDNKALYLKCAA